MSEDYAYVDENGVPLSAEEVAALGDDVEIVEEVEEVEEVDPVAEVVADAASTAPAKSVDVPTADEDAPPALTGRSKLLLVGGAIVAAGVIVGGVAFALNGVGNQNTVDDIKGAAQSKIAAASSSVVEKKEELTSITVDTCSTRGAGSLSEALIAGADRPELELKIISTAPLPSSFTTASTSNGAVQLLQLTKREWAAYAPLPSAPAEPLWRKAEALTSDNKITVTDDKPWPGGDVAAPGACEAGPAGLYATTGTIPSGAEGLVDNAANVDAISGVAGEPAKAVAVMGQSVALVELVEAPDVKAGDASSKPTK